MRFPPGEQQQYRIMAFAFYGKMQLSWPGELHSIAVDHREQTQ